MREVIAKRAAKELHDGDVVNLGIGIPTLIPNYLPEGVTVTLQTENGAMGMGPTPEEGKEDKNLINAGGGAMDLVVGAKRVILTMEHTQKGAPKILKECTLPLTAAGQVNMIITEMGVMDITPEGIVLKELHPEFTVEQVQAATEAKLIISPDLKPMDI